MHGLHHQCHMELLFAPYARAIRTPSEQGLGSETVFWVTSLNLSLKCQLHNSSQLLIICRSCHNSRPGIRGHP